jgi:RNA polymerase sigma-70 factor, ECF subfamily
MIGGNAQMRQFTPLSESLPVATDVRQPGGYNTYHPSEKRADYAILDIHDRMVKLLPRLRRFVRSRARGSDSSEDLIQETYVRALTHLDQWQPGTRLDSWMLRIAQNLWIDQVRAEKIRGDVVDIRLVDHLLSYDGRTVVESRLTLQDVRRDIAQLSKHQRDVIRLVCEAGLSHKEAGKILNLPTGTVMSHLARARDALHTVRLKRRPDFSPFDADLRASERAKLTVRCPRSDGYDDDFFARSAGERTLKRDVCRICVS